MYAGSPFGDRVCLNRSPERRAYSMSRRGAPYRDRPTILRIVDSMSCKPKYRRLVVDLPDRDKEHLAAFHRLHVQGRREPFPPILNHTRRIKLGAD